MGFARRPTGSNGTPLLTRWRVVDSGAGLHRWQLDLHWGQDDPRGPVNDPARPRSTRIPLELCDGAAG